MKKTLLICLVAALALIPAFADRTSNFGLAYTSSALNLASGTVEGSDNYSGIGLSFGGFTGGNFGFYGYDTLALPTSYKAILNGTTVSSVDDFSAYSTKVLMDAQFGLGGYVAGNATMRLLLGAGLNINMVSFIHKTNYNYDVMYCTLGPGAVADLSARMFNNLFITLQARVGYNIITLFSDPDVSSTFKNVFSLTPVIGFTVQR